MKVMALSNHAVFRSPAIVALATIFDVNVKHKPFEKRPDWFINSFYINVLLAFVAH